MKYSFKRLSWLLLLICFSTALRAQLIIAKDPRECLVGLKDSSGNWVVPPTYQQIEYYAGAYKVYAADKQGIISWTGKLIVPAIYTNIEHRSGDSPGLRNQFLTLTEQQRTYRYYAYFIVADHSKMGLVGPDGREIIPPSLLNFTHFFNGVAIGVNEQNQSVLLDTTGILCTLPADCSIRPDAGSMLATNRFLVAKKGTDGNGNVSTLYGVCNERGKFILPAIYSGFRPGLWRMNVLLADSAGLCGVFSLNGKQLSPFCYRLAKTPMMDEYTFNDFVFVSRDGQTGVLGRNGKLIVPCTYDSISVERKSIHETLFLCHTGAREDLYSDAKPILVGHPYDEVRIAKGGYQSYFHELVLLLVAKDQKWGALSESLHEYMPLQFDTVFTSEYYYLFYSGSSVRALYPVNANSESRRTMVIVPRVHEDASLVQANNPEQPYFDYTDTIGQPYKWYATYETDSGDAEHTFYMRSIPLEPGFCEVIVHDVWTSDSVHLIWQLPVSIEGLVACEQHYYNHDQTSCFAVVQKGGSFAKFDAYKTVLGSRVYFTTRIEGSRIYRSSGGTSIVPRSNKMSFDIHKHEHGDTTGFIDIWTSSGKHGAMSLSGELLADTLWYGNSTFSADTQWVATAARDWYDDCKPVWNLYSYKQHKLLLDTSNQLLVPPRIEPGQTGVALTKSGVGLFDSKTLRFTIAPVYRYIYPLDDSLHYFLVTGFDGVTRMTDQKGKAISSFRVYRAAIINKTSAWYDTTSAVDSFLIYSVTTMRGTFIAGNAGVHNYRSLNRDSLFEFLHHQRAGYRYAGRVTGTPLIRADSAIVLLRWQRELLCDSVVLGRMNVDYRASGATHGHYPYAFEQQDAFCDIWPAGEYISFFDESQNPVYAVTWNNPRVLCVKMHQDIYHDPWRLYETYLLYDSVPVKQELADLFINDQWKPVIIDALLARLDSQPQIRSNCTETDRYPEMLANRFLITADSLLLFPDWGMERYLYNPEICVAIAWSEPGLFLKPEVKAVLED